jgi:hypothetical protein
MNDAPGVRSYALTGSAGAGAPVTFRCPDVVVPDERSTSREQVPRDDFLRTAPTVC